MKRIVTFTLASLILLTSICFAEPLPKKKETVFVNLDSYGKVEKVNIYSKWITNGTLTLEDHTKYISVNNLTNHEKDILSGDSIIWKVSGEKNFTYTGEVGEDYYNKIPWTFDISYKINGVDATADELLGAKGLIKITIDIHSNAEANSYYRNNYLLEITGTYDMSKYLSVESEDAMITDTGNSKTLMFVVLPGQSTTIDLEIGSDNFSMDGITMALVPITGDIREQIIDLVEDKDNIKEAIETINTSSDIVLNSMLGMTSGIKGINSGVQEIKQGTQNLHGLNDVRDEDIEKLQVVLNELLPLMEQVQKDIDHLNRTYDIIIELDEELNEELKELSQNANQLNKDMQEVSQLMKNLPGDVTEINELLKATERVVNSSNSLVKKLSGSSSESTESLTNDLTEVGKDTATIGAIVQQTLPNVENQEMVDALLKIGSSANNIGTNLKSVQSTLTEMSDSTLSGTKNLQNNLNHLADELHEASEIMNKKDAQKITNLTQSLTDASKSLEKMLYTASNYNDKLLKNKDDFKEATNNMKEIVNEINAMNTISTSMITNLQNILNIISSDVYQGTNHTADAIMSVNQQLAQITSQSSQFKKSKDDIKKIVDNKMDEMEEKTTIFNMDKDAKTVSFGSDENKYVESVQFVLKTPDIKKIKTNQEDLEKDKETLGFWDKVRIIFQKIWDWITGIFNKNKGLNEKS